MTAPAVPRIDPLGDQIEWAQIVEFDAEGVVVDIIDHELLAALKLSPEVAKYMAERAVPVPMCPPKFKTPEPGEIVAEAVFSPEHVDRVIKAFHNLRHVTGKLAGRPLDPDPWEIAYIIAPWAGWLHYDDDAEDYVRIVTTMYVELPRKNGKTTIAGGIGIYMTAADGENAAQVIAAATTKDQARFTFDPILALAKSAPALKGYVRPLRGRITHDKSNSYFQPIANAGDAQHGANIHCAVIDELHLHKDEILIEALETGTGSREQPLILFITTADNSRAETPYDTRRMRIEALANGSLKMPSTYGVIWAADPGDDPFAETTWAGSNPGYGKSPTRRYLRERAAEARSSPAQFASFLRLHLGIRTKQTTRYLTMESWAANAGIVDTSKLKGRKCFGALDLATVSDVTALAYVFPVENRERYEVIWRFFIPELSLAALDRRTAENASVWKREGWLTTTPGNVTDYNFIQAQIEADAKEYSIESIAYDRWNSSQLVNNLTEDGVAEMVDYPQSYIGMNSATKELKRLLLLGTPINPKVVHGGNPVMRWMIDNFAIAMDPHGNVKPDKAESGGKIDGVVALIMALAQAMAAAEAPKRSIYEDDDVELTG